MVAWPYCFGPGVAQYLMVGAQDAGTVHFLAATEQREMRLLLQYPLQRHASMTLTSFY
jgi:hypothetical protein